MRRAIIVLALAALCVAAVAYAATVNLKIAMDSDVYAEVEAAVCAHYGYQAEVPVLDAEGVPVLSPDGTPQVQANPESRETFVRRQAKAFLLEHREAWLNEQASSVAVQASKAGRKKASEKP